MGRRVALLLGAFLVHGTVWADDAAPILVLVSSREAPSAQARDLAARLAARLGAPDEAAARQILDRTFVPPTPAQWDGAGVLAKVARARAEYYRGRFAEAAPLFAEVFAETQAHIDRIGENATLAEALFGAQMPYAVALARIDRRADAIELLRRTHVLFPDRRPTVTEFGPEVVELWETALSGAGRPRRVRVTAYMRDRFCTVRQNGVARGRDQVTLEDLPEGSLVWGECRETRSRLRRVAASTSGELYIDVAAEAALETERWVGLRLASREQDARAAASVAEAVGAHEVALLRMDGAHVDALFLRGAGRRFRVVGEAHSTLEDQAGTTQLVEDLAAAARDGESAPAESASTGDAATTAPSTSTGLIVGVAGGGLGVIGAVLYLVGRGSAIDALSAGTSGDRASAEDTAAPLLVAGGLLLPAGLAALAAGATLYFLPAEGRGLRGPAYAALLVGGAVLAGVGTWLLFANECEAFDGLCPAQGVREGPSTLGLGIGGLGLGISAAATGIVLRTMVQP